MGVVIGLGVPILPWLIHQRFPKLRMDLFVTPLFAYTIGFLSAGINSGTTMAVCIAIGSQYFWRKYRPTSFRKYNYILSAGLDAGMQFFVFILCVSPHLNSNLVCGLNTDALHQPSFPFAAPSPSPVLETVSLSTCRRGPSTQPTSILTTAELIRQSSASLLPSPNHFHSLSSF